MSLQVPQQQLTVQLLKGKEYYIGEITSDNFTVQQLKIQFPTRQLKMQANNIIAGKALFTVSQDVKDYVFASIKLLIDGNRIPTSTHLYNCHDTIEDCDVEVAVIPGFLMVKMRQSDQYYQLQNYCYSIYASNQVIKVFTPHTLVSEYKFENEKDLLQFCQECESQHVKMILEEPVSDKLQLAAEFQCQFTKYYIQQQNQIFVKLMPFKYLQSAKVGISNERFVIRTLSGNISVSLEYIWCLNYFDYETVIPRDDNDEKSIEKRLQNFLVSIKLVDGMRLLLVFDSQMARQRFSQLLLDELTQHFISPLLQYYEFDSKYQLDLPLSIANGKLIQKLYNDITQDNLIQSCAYLLTNDARTLPVIGKKTELIGLLLRHIEKTNNIQESSVCFDMLRKITSSRTLFISIVKDYRNQLFSVLKQFIGREQNEYVVCSAILLLRSILSYQWDPQVIGIGQSVCGLSQVYSVGIFSQIYLNLREKPVKKYFLYDLESEAFKDLDIAQTSSFKASIGLHSIFQQGKNYLLSRRQAEQENRNILLSGNDSILPLIGNIIAYFDSVKLPLVQTCILGIIEDIIITKSQIDNEGSSISATQQPAGRSELFTLVYECFEIFVNYSSCEIRGLKIASSLILYYLLNENILNPQFKNEISEYFLTSGVLLSHVKTMMTPQVDSQIQTITLSLLGILYYLSKNVQNLFNKIFPSSLLIQMPNSAQNYVFNYGNFRNLKCPYFAQIFDIAKQVQQEQYGLQIVWDNSIVESIKQQINQYISDYKTTQSLTEGKVSLNYELIKFTHNNISQHKYSQFDIDIHGYYLSQFLIKDLENDQNIIGSDLVEYYQNNQKQYFKQLKEKLQGFNAQSIVDLFYQAYCQIPHNLQVKAALIYAIHSLILSNRVQLKYVEELATEITVQIQQANYQLVLYLIYLLECVSYQIDPKDMLKRNYFYHLSEHFVVRFLLYKILPLILYKQNFLKLDACLGEDIDLIANPTYGNLVLVSLRYICNCLIQQSNYDLDGNILYPAPSIYGILQDEQVLEVLVGILVVCNKDYQTSKTSVSQDISIQIYQILQHLLSQNEEMAVVFSRLGFIEIALSNSFDQVVNNQIFMFIQQLVQKSSQCIDVLKLYLPIPFCTFVELYQPEQSAMIFTENSHISLNIIWSKSARDNLAGQICKFEEEIWQSLAELTKEDIANAQFANSVALVQSKDQSDVFLFAQFKALDEHYMIQMDRDLQEYEQHRYGNLYLSLIQQSNFVEVEKKLGHHDDEEIAQFYSKMIAEFEGKMSLQQCIDYLETILQVTDFQEILEEDFLISGIADLSQSYIHTITKLILQASQKQFSAVLQKIKQYQSEEVSIRQSLDQYIRKTGGSGKSVLKSLKLSDPAVMLEKRKRLVTIFLKLSIIQYALQKSLSSAFEQLSGEFDQYDVLYNMLDLSEYLLSLNMQQQISNISNYIPDKESKLYQKCTEFSVALSGLQKLFKQNIVSLLQMVLQDIIHNNEKASLDKVFNYLVHLSDIYMTSDMLKDTTLLQWIEQLFGTYYRQNQQLDEQTDGYINTSIKLLAIITQFQDQAKAATTMTIVPYLFLFMFASRQNAAVCINQIAKIISQSDAQFKNFILSLSYLGYCFSQYNSSAQVQKESQRNIFTESFVYSLDIKGQIQNFLWEIINGNITVNSEFDCDAYLKREFKVFNYYVLSMLSITLAQAPTPKDLQMPNFSSQIALFSQNDQIVADLIKFITMYHKYTFQTQNAEVSGQLLKQIDETNCVALTAVMLIIGLQLLYQEESIKLVSKNTLFVKILISYAVGDALNPQQEILAETSMMILSRLSLNGNNESIVQYANCFLQVVTNNVQMDRGLQDYLIADDDWQLLQEDEETKALNFDFFKGFNEQLINRRCYAQLVLLNIQQQSSIQYLCVVELMLFLQNTIIQTDEEEYIKQFIIVTSAKSLQQLCQADIFLNNILQKPQILNFIKGDISSTISIVKEERQTPNFVWNQQCADDLLKFLEQLYNNDIIKAVETRQQVDLSQYHYFNDIQYIKDTYTVNNDLVADVYLSIYNSNSSKRQTYIANPEQLILQLITILTSSSTQQPENSQLFLASLTALANLTTQQKQYILIILSNEHFEDLFQALFIDNQYINLLPYQISQQTLFQETVLLQNLLHASFDYKLSSQCFIELIHQFYACLPQISFTLNEQIEQPVYSLQTAEKLLLAISAFLAMLIQVPQLRIDFCSLKIGRVQGEIVTAPFIALQLIQQDNIPRFIKLTLICLISTILQKSPDFGSVFKLKYQGEKYHQFISAVLQCQVGFKQPINGGLKESLDEQIPVPECDIYKEWSCERLQVDSSTGYDSKDSENCLAGFVECSISCKQFNELARGISKNIIKVANIEEIKNSTYRGIQCSILGLCSGENWTQKYLEIWKSKQQE